MEYRVKYSEYDGVKERVYFSFDPPFKMLSAFLDAEVSNFFESMLEEFKLVLSGKRRRYESSGNAFFWIIGPKTTKIVDMFPCSENTENVVVVGTTELVQLMKEWNAARQEFAEKGSAGVGLSL